MELTRQNRSRLQAPRFAIHLQLPLYVRLLLGTMVVVAGVSLLTRLTQPPSNPFSPYADLLPGQPTSTLELSGFSCDAVSENPQYSRTYVGPNCEYFPESGLFEYVRVIPSADDVVVWASFTVRDNVLTVGDLAALWGRPEIIASYSGWMTLHWPAPEMSVTAWTERGRFSYFLPLRRVTFTETL